MLSDFLLSVLPLLTLGGFGLAAIAQLFWRVFARSRALDEAASVSDASAALRLTSITVLLFGLVIVPALHPLATCLQSAQSSIALLTFGLVSALASNRFRHPDILVFIVFTALAAVYLLNAADVLTLFFVLELLNALVLYSFFFTASYTGAGQSSAASRIASSCVYQFTLNFFSSIALYVGMTSYIALTGGSSLTHASLWSFDQRASLGLTLFILAFLIKFGTGPWIFFKVNVYRNMNFQLVLLYSAAYMLVIFTLFLNLLFVFGAALSGFAAAFIIALVVAASALFGGLAFQNPNIFVFISFSSLLNMGVFVLQAVAVA